jgi:transposase
MGYSHSTVNHSKKEYARDDDGDGFCEVHCNTLEGLWAALRTFLRPFRGVHKRYLAQYVVMFEWEYNLKNDFKTLLRAMLLIDSP